MVWPERDQVTADARLRFLEGASSTLEPCQYCLGTGSAFNVHPYSQPGLMGDTVCPVCQGQGVPLGAEDVVPGDMPNLGSPGIGGGGDWASNLGIQSWGRDA